MVGEAQVLPAAGLLRAQAQGGGRLVPRVLADHAQAGILPTHGLAEHRAQAAAFGNRLAARVIQHPGALIPREAFGLPIAAWIGIAVFAAVAAVAVVSGMK